MKLPEYDYTAPVSVDQACRILKENGDAAEIIAGGTALVGRMKNRQKTPGLLVDLKEIPGMDRIQYGEKEGLEIGAMVSLRHLASHPVIKEKYPVLARAASMVGTVQLQAMGTLGGNLCQDNCCVYFDRPAMWREGSGPWARS